ncbi:hypothetical protein RHMOL_Rhmol02G0305000 [Rhododendron molle]|uniref:Uncharacterized protein n=1 Tax=Rhododendron molle TaxID=49168 RepID=A0ACC0PXE1_RHOML|nr:hypothetical protein RHMOL_Rhmol02G0305000 [Rhododendron molle]
MCSITLYKENPQRHLVLHCEVATSWALPVFEYSSQICVGVLVVVSLAEKRFDSYLYDFFQNSGQLKLRGNQMEEYNIQKCVLHLNERNDLAQTYLDEAARRMKRATLLGDNSERSTNSSPTCHAFS